MFRRLRIPEPEKEQRARRQIRRMADARQREMKLVRFFSSITLIHRCSNIVLGRLHHTLQSSICWSSFI